MVAEQFTLCAVAKRFSESAQVDSVGGDKPLARVAQLRVGAGHPRPNGVRFTV